MSRSDLYAAPPEFVLQLGEAYSSLPQLSKRVTYKGDLRTTTNGLADTPQLLLPVPDLRFAAAPKRAETARRKASPRSAGKSRQKLRRNEDDA